MASSETAYIARRQLNELAFAVAATRRDPAAFYNGLSYGNSVSEREAGTQEGNWCTLLPGQPCWKRNEQSPALEVAKRDAEAQNGNWCTVLPGQPCWKRNASVEERRNADPFCSQFVGESCYKRDETPAVAEQYKRCVSEGQPCWHAKRIASAVVNAIDAGNAQRMKREVTQEWAKRAPAADAACNAADSACHLAARDLHAVYNVARTNLEA